MIWILEVKITSSGEVNIGHNLVDNADFRVVAAHAGTIRVVNELRGIAVCSNDVSGRILVLGNLVGQIRVNQSLLNGVSGPEIDIDGAMASSAAIAIDYDGWDAGHDWQSGATVTVGSSSPYTGNGQGFGIWEITCCRGDMDNSGLLNNFDIDPFVMALTDPPAYDAAFPGLDASRDWHADCNATGWSTTSTSTPS
ncbi:MAG: hypothetical protein JNG88_08475 [Phycisphaerales bacterium]|nr:hypothetical protein [Phycisphaerales bacterium]